MANENDLEEQPPTMTSSSTFHRRNNSDGNSLSGLTTTIEDDEDRPSLQSNNGSRATFLLQLFGVCGVENIVPELSKMALLVLLYFIQGVPMGLVFGSIPFLLKNAEGVTFTQIGIFSFAAYPYSLKLLWSPLVDALYHPSFGQRKSWIVPTQIVAGCLMIYISYDLEAELRAGTDASMYRLMISFLILIFLVATQDIAVDGWSLTILSPQNRSFASTCQTIGLNMGFFLSFTVFLALNSAEFCNSYLRIDPLPDGVLSISGYLHFWGIVYIVSAVWVALAITEGATHEQQPHSIMTVYRQMRQILGLPMVRHLLVVLLLCKVGSIANDSVTALKLLEKGFKREHMGLFALIEFPFQVVFAILAGRWTAGKAPLKPYRTACILRLLAAVLAAFLVWGFPEKSGPTAAYFVLALVVTLFSSFASTMMFVAIGGFFARISDTNIGGTYLTLLNTISNLGGMWPKFFALRAVDLLSFNQCVDAITGAILVNGSCDESDAIEQQKEVVACTSLSPHATCVKYDGYYPVTAICICFGFLIYFLLLRGITKKLEDVVAQKRLWTIVSLSKRDKHVKTEI